MAIYFLDKEGLSTFWSCVKDYYSASTIDSRIGYAVMAGKLSATKTISLSGDATGSVTTDFSSNPSISVTIADATSDTHGLMSVTDKARFDSLATIKSINSAASTATSDGLELDSNGKLTLKIKDYVTTTVFNAYKSDISDALDLKAPLASPTFTGTITVNGTKVLDEDEVDSAIKAYVSGAEVLRFKGVVDTNTFNALTSYTKGDTYKAKADGTYAGNICEAGDMLICVSSYGTTFNNADWSVIQTNIDGYVIGPASATDGNIPLFDGTTGKLLKNSSYNPSSFLSSSTKYAASSSVGGSANSAVKLTTEDVGSVTKPIYFKGGIPVVGSYELNKTVPSDAVFTDTKVTAVENHYTPTGTDTKSVDASSTASAVYGETSLVTGVNLTVDKAGHLTDISVNSIRMPEQYSHPTHTAYASGLYKVTVDSLGHVSSATAVGKTDITNLGIPGENTWRSISVDDVSKLTDTATALNFLSGANIDITYDSTKNGVQFDVSGLGGLAYKDSLSASDVGAIPSSEVYIKSISKDGDTLTITPSSGESITFTGATYGEATTSANGLMSSSDKSKLDGIESGAQVNTITGIKGDAETTYRTGNVNITPANIGALPSTTTFVKSIIKSGSTLTITPSSGEAITFTDTDTVYAHPDSGVTAGTYKSVIVNAQGHVTAGTNPTTLSGYGITDAKITDGVITLGSNSITPLTSHQAVSSADNTATWGSSVTVGTVGGTALTFKMPANPDTNTTYSFATGSTNGTFKVTPSSGTASEVAIKGLGSLAYKGSLSASDVGAIASSLKGANSGVAELDENGKVPSSQLPSYVDDVLEYTTKSSFPEIGETGKIYVDATTNLTYRWSGTAYVEISPSLALGETSSTAYRGDRGKIAYDHSQVTSGNPHNVTCSEIGALPTTTKYAGSSSVGGAATTAVALTTSAGNTTTPVYFVDGKPQAIGFSINKTVPSDAIFTDTTYSVATTSANGLMSSSDKSKLDSIAEGANNYALPNATSTTLGGVKVGSNITVADGIISLVKNNVISALGYTPAEEGVISGSISTTGTITTTNETGIISAIEENNKSISELSGAINATGGIVSQEGIAGAKVYNAVWNDLADCIPVNDEAIIEPGYCYCFDGNKYYKSSKYLDEGIIGIQSDTYGMHMGHKPGIKQMDVAVAGFVLAYVDKEYSVGTPLTCGENGVLTEIRKQDKIEYPERIVATYWKNETHEYWGSETNKVAVNGRKWVKVK